MTRFIIGRYYKMVIGKTNENGGYFIGRAVGEEKLKIIIDTDSTGNRYKIGEIYDRMSFFTEIKEISEDEVRIEVL